MSFDLLDCVEDGGCSAKLNPEDLGEILKQLPSISDPRFIVDSSKHDDAGVYKINEETAIIFTTDFFPPLCSDAYDYGQIAAANALSDVYAMGGTPIMALNLSMFSITKLPKEVISEIIRGGADKVKEASCFIVGGHTIDDHPPKYGLAVVGSVHPEKILSNTNARVGDVLILTKAIGTGGILAAYKEKMCSEDTYRQCIESMKQLNKDAAEIIQNYRVSALTDITGFGLAGHALEMAKASEVSIEIDSASVPLFAEVYAAYDDGCIPGACFRNFSYVEDDCAYDKALDYNLKLLMHDAQTSGGFLVAVHREDAAALLKELEEVYPMSRVVGEISALSKKALSFI